MKKAIGLGCICMFFLTCVLQEKTKHTEYKKLIILNVEALASGSGRDGGGTEGPGKPDIPELHYCSKSFNYKKPSVPYPICKKEGPQRSSGLQECINEFSMYEPIDDYFCIYFYPTGN